MAVVSQECGELAYQEARGQQNNNRQNNFRKSQVKFGVGGFDTLKFGERGRDEMMLLAR